MADEGLRRRRRRSYEDEPQRDAVRAGDSPTLVLPASVSDDGEGDGDDSGSIGRMVENCVAVNAGSASCLLESYRGRDKAVRLLHYALMMAAGLWPNAQYADALGALSVALGNARIVGRLFDDLSVLRCTLAYGWGRQEMDWCTRLLTLVCNAASQAYYPLEHVAFLADTGAINVDAQYWWALSLVAWGLALLASAVRSGMAVLWMCKSLPAATTETDKLKEINLGRRRRMLIEFASATKDSADLITVVHWLLEMGLSWPGGCLTMASVGALGTLSSALGIWLMAVGVPISPSDS